MWFALVGCAAKGAVKESADTAQADSTPNDASSNDSASNDVVSPDSSVGDDLDSVGEPDADIAPIDPDGETLDAPGDSTSPPVTVKAIQNPVEPRGCNENASEQPFVFGSVTVENVVVTGGVHEINTTLVRFYVADRDGGPYSGIAVVADTSVLSALFPDGGPNVGDVLTLTGELQEFYCFTRIKLAAGGATRTDTGQPLPAPIVVSSCAEMRDESLEGVVVTLLGVKVVNNSLDHGEILVEDSTTATCVIDDDFQLWENGPVGGTQTDPNKPGVAATEYLSITGVLHYTFADFKLEPRTLDEIVAKGGSQGDTSEGDLDTSGDDTSIPDTSTDDTAETTGSDVEADTTAPVESVVCINELHYNNDSTDSNEGIELMGPAGMALTNWKIVLYNGATGKMYNTKIFTSADKLDQNPIEGIGFLWVAYPTNGIQNGDPDGLALFDDAGTLIRFISWGGTFTAADGPAAGQLSTNIDVKEVDTTPVGQSLQKVGTGRKCTDFVWSAPKAATAGIVNDGQVITPAPGSDATEPDGDDATTPDGDDAEVPDTDDTSEPDPDDAA
ncbi:MAG: hypothetical protein KC609_19270 [Myxococcales bacterium]|nr:hypothetical protein [Myxococcales bacterium]